MTVIAFAGWGYASWEGLRSKANQKAAESIYTSPFDPGRGLDLALEAVQTTPFGISPIDSGQVRPAADAGGGGCLAAGHPGLAARMDPAD